MTGRPQSIVDRRALRFLLPYLRIAAWTLVLSLWTGHAAAEEKGFVPPAGSLWTKVHYERWWADAQYAGPFGADLNHADEVGDSVDLTLDEPGTRFTNEAVGVELRIVPFERFIARASLAAYQRSTFERPAANTTTVTEGTGDLFAFIGYQLTANPGPVGNAMYLHAKFPTTGRDFSDIVASGLELPLSEGQVDIAVENATTVAVLPSLHVTGGLLFRHRFEVEQEAGGGMTRTVKPGDETEVALGVGGAPFERLWLKLTYKGMWATASEDRSFKLGGRFEALEKRQIHTLTPAAYLKFGGWLTPALDALALDAALRLPVGGVDFIRGPAISIGLAYDFNWHQ